MKDLLSLFHAKKNTLSPKPGKISFFSLIGNDAFVDWAIIVSAASLIAAVLIGVGGYMYVSAGDELGSVGSASPATHAAVRFDVNKLKSITALFDARADEKVMLLKAYNGPKDPSLP